MKDIVGIIRNINMKLLLLLLVVCTHAGAQNRITLVEVDSLEELLKLARIQNPDVKSYELNVTKRNYDVKTSKAARLPSIAGSFSGQRNLALATTPVPGEFFGQPGTTVNAQFGQEYAYNAGITISKSFLDRQTSLKIKMAQLTLEAAEVQQDAYFQLLNQQVSLNYYSLLIAKRAIALAEKNIEIADSIALLGEQRFQEGLVDALAVNQARINTNVTKQNLNSSKQLYENSNNELKMLLGLGDDDTLKVLANIQYELPLMYGASDLRPNDNIRLASLNKDQAQNQVKIQKSMFLPKVSIASYYGKQQFVENFEIDFGNSTWSNYRYLGLNLSLPILTGFSNQNKLKASRVDLELAENELTKTNLKSQMQDIRLITEYHTSIKNTHLAMEAFQLYEQNERLTLQKYSEGMISLDRYLNAFQDYLKAENAFLNTLLNTYSYYSQIIPRIQ
uniref:TolC family protein n=1 Tax=Algoriphagus sp. TaxID=1872435 RepID=UPI004047D964